MEVDMKHNTNNSPTVVTRWTFFLAAMVILALMVPAIAFSQPTLVSPTDLTLNVSTGPTLSWTSVPLATTYHLQVSLANTFVSTVYDNAALTGTSQAILPVLANGTQFYWRVSDNHTSTYSAVQSFTTNPTPVDLGTAGSFRILANTGITGGAGSTITGDIGCLAAASTITGFSLVLDGGLTFATSASVVGGGKVYAFDYAAPTPTNLTAAQGFMGTAYTNAANRTPVPVGTYLNAGSTGEIGGLNLGPGLYKWTSAVTISNDLTLTGNSTDVWIFQMASTLDLANAKSILLVGGALSSNVFWQVAGQVTLIGTSAMKGIILGQTGIAMGANGTLDGRALAQTNVTLITNTVLPVELVSFTAKANQTSANLHWSTATETNNYGFEIERRQTATWEKIGFVAGAGTSTSPRNYSYTDNNLSSGSYAYRIKQINKNGTFSYNGSAQVEIGSVAKKFELASNYPNPFNPSTTVQFTLENDGMATLTVFNLLGQKVMTLFSDNAQAGKLYLVRFDATSLPTGLYFAQLQSGSQRMIQKMALVK
jgi:hypothetical protein